MNIFDNLDAGWRTVLSKSITCGELQQLSSTVLANYLLGSPAIYPKQENLFAALNLTHINNTKVVILGQDPYHGPDQAMGLAFSVPAESKLPPSLRNIFKEIQSDPGISAESSLDGDLTRWSKQGVLLLNTRMTVEEGKPGSHRNIGWEIFTDEVIRAVDQNREHVVFMLWGASAIEKKALINPSKHLVLTAAHPSPLSAYRGFFGCKHFSQCNTYLQEHNIEIIQW